MFKDIDISKVDDIESLEESLFCLFVIVGNIVRLTKKGASEEDE